MSDEWKSETPKANDDKSWKLLEKAVLAGVQEQRRARRWGIFFKSLTFIYLFVVLLASVRSAAWRNRPRAAVATRH